MSKRLVAFNGSPRKNGNTSLMLDHFLQGAKQNNVVADVFDAAALNIAYCKGCLRCNVLGYCSIRDDEWSAVSQKILESDILVFASPIYFHHVSASLKKIIDRFRSFVKVQVTETGLLHTPHQLWNKDIVLLLTMGSSDKSDADPVIELFRYITSILGTGNKLHVIAANRMVVVNQLLKDEEELKVVYNKLLIPEVLAEEDAAKNQRLLKEVADLGNTLMAGE